MPDGRPTVDRQCQAVERLRRRLGMELPGVQRLMGLLLMLLGARGPGRLQGRPLQQEQGPGEQLP